MCSKPGVMCPTKFDEFCPVNALCVVGGRRANNPDTNPVQGGQPALTVEQIKRLKKISKERAQIGGFTGRRGVLN